VTAERPQHARRRSRSCSRCGRHDRHCASEAPRRHDSQERCERPHRGERDSVSNVWSVIGAAAVRPRHSR
jgi:hypothetical protein